MSRVLGTGTYSVVYERDDHAVKHIRSDDKVYIPSYVIWEVCIPTTLSHRNIVKIEKVEVNDRGMYIYMPIYTAITTLTISIMYKLIHALHYMHIHNIIHRDIKPSNIMVDGEGEPIIIDFSIARVHLLDVMSIHTYSPYFRHEKVATGRYGYECDIYALGKTFEHMLTSYTIDGDVTTMTKITNLLLSCTSLDAVMDDPIFSNLDTPIHSPPIYRDKRDLTLADIERVDWYLQLYKDIHPSTRAIALSILSQVDSTTRIQSIIHIVICIYSDDIIYDIRMDDTYKIVDRLYIPPIY